MKGILMILVVATAAAVATAAPVVLTPGVSGDDADAALRAEWAKTTREEYEAKFTYPRSLKNKANRECPSDALPVGQTRITTNHDGRSRQYVVHIPRFYNNSVNLPLVFDVHGYTNTAERQASLSGLRGIADDEHFIVVNPEGTGALQSWNGGDCCVGNREDDVGFFLRMIEEVADNYACIDLNRVYSGGYSNGGFMSHYLACQTDAIAAIGPSAGCVSLPCRQTSHPVAAVHFHGTNDGTIPYDGNFAYESAPTSWETWAEVNDCTAQERIVYQNGQTTCVSRFNCANLTAPAESVLCTVQGAGHMYNFNSWGVDTGEYSWDFYKHFSL